MPNSSEDETSEISSSSSYDYQKPNTMKSAKFPGAKRYVYFEDSKPVYVWANYDITKPVKTKKKTTKFVIFLVFWLLALLSSVHHPTKLIWTQEELSGIDVRNPVIIDNTNVLGDTTSLKAVLKDFYKTTGIMPSVMTTEDSKWINNYTAMEHYVYDVYVNTFNDEKHWLIMFSTSGNEGNSGTLEDWKWYGSQGQDTDPILTSHETNYFNNRLQKYLLQREQYDTGEAIVQAFNDFNKVVMKTYLPRDKLFGALLVLIVAVLIFLFASGGLHPNQEALYKDAKLCPEDFVDEDKCEYCGSIYSILRDKKCPNCGAPVKAHDYTTDKNGNITGILN